MKHTIKRALVLLLTLTLLMSTLPCQAFAADLKLNYAVVYLAPGETFQMKNIKGGSTKWKSSKSSVASISKSGKVTAKKKGTVTITATCGGKKATAKITVKSSKKAAALATYKRYLQRDKISWGDFDDIHVKENEYMSFGLAYIDNNSVPELVIDGVGEYGHMAGCCNAYTYKNGKVVDLKLNSDNLKYYKKTGVIRKFYANCGMYEDDYYKLASGKVSFFLKECGSVDSDNAKYYGSSYETISKTTFKSRRSKVIGKTKVSDVSTHRNTQKNRDKYLG